MIIDNQLTIERIKKMFAYFQRHEVDKKAEGFNEGEKGYPSAGVIAWNLWGGDPGMDWSTRKRIELFFFLMKLKKLKMMIKDQQQKKKI